MIDGGVGSSGSNFTPEPAELRKTRDERDTAARFNCRKQGRGTIALHGNVWSPIKIPEGRFEHFVVFAILGTNISRERLIKKVTERHFPHSGKAMLMSYRHT